MAEDLKALVEAAGRGDSGACAALYRLSINGALGRARSMVRSEEDALDIVQESYIQAFRSLGSLEKPESFQSWLNRIVVNRCKNFLSRSKPLRYDVSLTGEEGEELDREDESIQFRPDASLDYSETKRMIREIVDGLPQQQRSCILLHYFQELKLSEIARILEIPENTVKSSIRYAKAKIKKEVQELERRGVKLYAVPVLPFLRWAMEQSTAELAAGSGGAVLSHTLEALGAGGASAAGGAAASQGAAAAGTGAAAGAAAGHGGILGAAGAKALAAAAAAVLAVGGVAAVAVRQPAQEPPAASSAAPAVSSAAPVSEEPEAPRLPPTREELDRLVQVVQEEREAQGLPPIQGDETYMAMAAQRAEESAGTTEARRPDGSYFFTIFEEYGLENPRHSGQSLFRTATLEEAAQRLEGGMGNIYQEEITAIGIGCYFDEADETNPYCWAVLTGGR